MVEATYKDAETVELESDDKLTFREIVLSHVRKIASLACVEFRGGYYDQRLVSVGGGVVTHKVYVPDTRECYCNAVDCLADLLSPYFDEEMATSEVEALKPLGKLVDSKLYPQESLKAHRKLFRDLCKFLYRKRYLDLGVMED